MPGKITARMLRNYRDLSFEEWTQFLNRHKDNHKLLGGLLAMSLVDYTEMEKEIDDAPEPTTLSAGTETKARIISVRTGTSDKNDCNWFSPVYDSPEEPMVKEFNDFFWELDREHLTDKEYQRALHKFKSFRKTFGVDISRPVDWEDDLPSLIGWIIVGLKKDDEYGEQNTVRRYVQPK